MSRKGQFLLGLNVLNAALLGVLAITGIVIKWVLPPGMGRHGGSTLLSLSRHDWGDLHFWVALIFVVSVALHLAMHASYIRAAVKPGWQSVVPQTPSA